MKDEDIEQMNEKFREMKSLFQSLSIAMIAMEDRIRNINASSSSLISPSSQDSTDNNSPVVNQSIIIQTNRPPLARPPSPNDFRQQRIKDSAKEFSPMDASQTLGIAGALILVVAVIFLIKLGIDNGVLTPDLQLAGGVLAGFLCLGVALYRRKTDLRYFSLLGGAGLGILYIDAFASHSILKLVTAQSALAATALVSGLAIVLSRYFRTQAFGIIACIATLTAPLILSLHEPILLSFYFAIWGIIFAYLAHSFVAINLFYLSTLLGLLGTFALSEYSGASATWLLPALLLLPQFVIFTVTLLGTAWQRKASDFAQDSISVAGLAVLFHLQQLEFLPDFSWINPNATIVSLLIPIALFAALPRARKNIELFRPLIGATIAISFFVDYYLYYHEAHSTLPIVGLIICGICHCFPGWRKIAKIGLSMLACLFVYECIPFFVLFKTDLTPYSLFILCLYTIIAYVAVYLGRGKQYAGAGLYFAHVLCLRALLDFSANRLIVTLLWSLFAIGILFLAKHISSRKLGVSSLLIFTASGLKATFYDLDESQPLYQIGCFLILGISLYSGGLLLKQIKDPEL